MRHNWLRVFLEITCIFGGLTWFISVGGYHSLWGVLPATIIFIGLDMRYGGFDDE